MLFLAHDPFAFSAEIVRHVRRRFDEIVGPVEGPDWPVEDWIINDQKARKAKAFELKIAAEGEHLERFRGALPASSLLYVLAERGKLRGVVGGARLRKNTNRMLFVSQLRDVKDDSVPRTEIGNFVRIMLAEDRPQPSIYPHAASPRLVLLLCRLSPRKHRSVRYLILLVQRIKTRDDGHIENVPGTINHGSCTRPDVRWDCLPRKVGQQTHSTNLFIPFLAKLWLRCLLHRLVRRFSEAQVQSQSLLDVIRGWRKGFIDAHPLEMAQSNTLGQTV